jgi:acyl carrier protein
MGTDPLATNLDRIRDLLVRVTEAPDLAADVTEETDLLNDLGLDSLHMITFLLSVEEEFDVEINFESLEPEHLQSVLAFCEFALRTGVNVN